ncbi:MAG: redox-sensing transcriptional repressor Rex [Phycisphaerae bacterium]|nr:redox-sensing transcriptional repressor Rex [Phycisphaerae bacterium]
MTSSGGLGGAIPDPSVRRLSAYLRHLENLAASGVKRVSSRQLAEYVKGGDAQVRRDLALFGQFGRRGVGYDVEDLIQVIRTILGTRAQWNVVVVGAGQLCQALLRYRGFKERGFALVGAFDTDPRKIGTQCGPVTIRHIDAMEDIIRKHEVRLAILTVPAQAAQQTAEKLAAAGIEGIMNFAGAGLSLPPHVHVSQVDLTAHLEQLSFLVSSTRAGQ